MPHLGIWLCGPGSFTDGIAYAENDRGNDNNLNENLSIVEANQALFLRPTMGMRFQGCERNSHLTQEGAAKFYWSMMIEPLQI